MGNNFILKFQDAYIELVLTGDQTIDRSTAGQLWSTMENLGLKLGYNRFLLSAASAEKRPRNPACIDTRSVPGHSALVKVACVNVEQAVLAGFLADADICDNAVTGFFDDRVQALAWLTPPLPADRKVPARIPPAPDSKYFH